MKRELYEQLASFYSQFVECLGKSYDDDQLVDKHDRRCWMNTLFSVSHSQLVYCINVNICGGRVALLEPLFAIEISLIWSLILNPPEGRCSCCSIVRSHNSRINSLLVSAHIMIVAVQHTVDRYVITTSERLNVRIENSIGQSGWIVV